MPTRLQRFKDELHRRIDPVLVLPGAIRARRALAALPDGEYRLPVEVPYLAQFATPGLIHAYIHEGLSGVADPAWPSFGAPDPATYEFWARRVCALACLKMAGQAYGAGWQPTLYELVQRGLALDGYRAYDAQGRLVDQGWFFPAIVQLARELGVQAMGRGYVALDEVCRLVHAGWLVAPSVTPEIGEHGPLRRYGGHMVLVYGFRWQGGRCTHVLLHNPSGRTADLQAGAVIPAARFRQAFAHRLIAFRADSL